MAIALAARENCNIFIDEALLLRQAIGEPTGGRIFAEKTGQPEQYDINEFYNIPSNPLEKEDYETAGKIRDITRKRQQTQVAPERHTFA